MYNRESRVGWIRCFEWNTWSTPLNQVEVVDDVLMVQGEQPDFILLNNDLTDGGLEGLSAASVLPSPQMGWYQRKSHSILTFYATGRGDQWNHWHRPMAHDLRFFRVRGEMLGEGIVSNSISE